MQLKIIGSGSKGNAYLLVDDKGETLMIECGVKAASIKEALNFDTSKVVGCLVSHEHNDHAKYIQEVMSWGVNVFSSRGTLEAKSFYHEHRAVVIEKGSVMYLGDYRVCAFDVKHDAAEPLNFLIEHPEMGKIVFITDTFYVPYTFQGLNNIIVEANFCEAIINEKMGRGSDRRFLRDRIIQSHFSLQNCKDFLKANDLSAVNNIVLIHLSDSNSDENRFRQEVAELTGKTVHTASNGLTISFNRTPF